jgi:predicted dehydrogenase
MGFIGLGGQGAGHLLGGAWTYVPGGYMARDDVQVRAVCDVRRERRERARQRCNDLYAQRFERPGYRDVQACNDFRDVLKRDDIDAVLLALPYHWAAPMSIMAMRAGKDVYCEKPTAITIQEAQAVARTARRYGRIYQAGMQQRSEYSGRFRRACEYIRNGRIGQLKEVYAYRPPGALLLQRWTSDHRVPVPPGLDWDLWLGPLPWRPYGGHAGHTLPDLFVGDVNWSPHHYDIIQWTVNPDPFTPVTVEYDRGQVHYRYQHGVAVHSAPYPGESVGPDGGACFVGTEGRIVVDRGRIVSYPNAILREPLLPGDTRVYHADSHAGNFINCMRSRRRTICDPETAAATMNTIFAGGIALALERSVRWDPAQHTFPGDDRANRLRSYAPRPPWRF